MSEIGGETRFASTFKRFSPHVLAFLTRIEACMTEMKRPVASSSVLRSKEAEVTLTLERLAPRDWNPALSKSKMTDDGGKIQGWSASSSRRILRRRAQGLFSPAMIQCGSLN